MRTFCGGHQVFEQNIELSNYQSLYPEEFRYARNPEGYMSNWPGTTYLDTPASNAEGLENFSVGTLDPGQFEEYVWYYGHVVAHPDFPGPNWVQIRFDIGDEDQWGCGIWVSPEWCMLDPHADFSVIPLKNNYTVPGYFRWDTYLGAP